MEERSRVMSFDLIRMIAIFMVICFHYIAFGAFDWTKGVPMNNLVIQIFKVFSVIGVNLFLLLTGYFLSKKNKRNLSVVIGLFFINFFCNFIVNIFENISSNGFITISLIKLFLGSLVFISNWYVAFYTVLYLVSPFINKVLRDTTVQQDVILTLILLFFFILYPSIIDGISEYKGITFDGCHFLQYTYDGGGYSLNHFIVLYIFGLYMRKYDFCKMKFLYPLMCYFFGFVMCFIEQIRFNCSYNYNNAFVVLMAISFFILVSKINIRHSIIITEISRKSFWIYCLHRYPFVMYTTLNLFKVKEVCSSNPLLIVLNLLVYDFTLVFSFFVISIPLSFVFKKIGKLILHNFPFLQFSYVIGDE